MTNRVSECVPQPLHGGVQPMLEIDKRVRRPQSLAQLLARDEGAGMFEEHFQKAQRLFGKRDAVAASSKLAGVQVELEVTEPDRLG